MANVTCIMILATLSDEEEAILEKQLENYTGGIMPFVKFDNCKTGGDKCLESTIYTAAFRNFDHELFIDVIKKLKDLLDKYVWEDVQIMIKDDENDCKWRLVYAPKIHEAW